MPVLIAAKGFRNVRISITWTEPVGGDRLVNSATVGDVNRSHARLAGDLSGVGDGQDPYMMATFHRYDPWTFCGDNQGTYDDNWTDANLPGPMDTMLSWAKTTGKGMPGRQRGICRDLLPHVEGSQQGPWYRPPMRAVSLGRMDRRGTGLAFVALVGLHICHLPDAAFARAPVPKTRSVQSPSPEILTYDVKGVTLDHDESATTALLCPDNRRIANIATRVGMGFMYRHRIVDAHTGKDTMPPRDAQVVAFSPDCKYLATVSAQETADTVEIFKTETNELIGALPGSKKVTFVKFDPTGSHVLVATKPGLLDVFSVSPLRLVRTLEPGCSSIDEDNVRFGPGGALVAAQCGSTRKIYSLTSPSQDMSLLVDRDSDISFFDTQGLYAVSTFRHGQVAIMRIPSGQVILRRAFESMLFSLSFAPDSRFAFFLYGDRLRGPEKLAVYDLRTGSHQAISHDEQINTLAVSPDHRYLATASCDNQVFVIDLHRRRKIATITHDRGVYDVQFSSDGRYLLSTTAQPQRDIEPGCEILLFDRVHRKTVARLKRKERSCTALFHPTLPYVLAVSSSSENTTGSWGDLDGLATASLYSIDGKQEQFFLEGNKKVWLSSISFSPDGSYIFMALNRSALVMQQITPAAPNGPTPEQ